MGIIIDIILILILILSAYLGYKKGLVELGAKIFAGIIAIIITLIIYKPVSNIIINNTSIDEKIENIIIDKTSNLIDENSQISNNQYIQNTTDNITTQIKEDTLPDKAKNISINIVYILTLLIIFILTKIALTIVISLANFIAKLPILKQFNEIGGFAYGLIRGLIIICVVILLMGIFIKCNPNNELENTLDKTYITKIVYKNIVKF